MKRLVQGIAVHLVLLGIAIILLVSGCSDSKTYICLPEKLSLPDKPAPIDSIVSEKNQIRLGGDLLKKTARFKKLYDNGDKTGAAAYILAVIYMHSAELGDCRVVKACLQTGKKAPPYPQQCISKLAELRDNWINEAIEKEHPDALYEKAALVGIKNSDPSLGSGNVMEITPEVLIWVKRAAKAKNKYAMEIMELRKKNSKENSKKNTN